MPTPLSARQKRTTKLETSAERSALKLLVRDIDRLAISFVGARGSLDGHYARIFETSMVRLQPHLKDWLVTLQEIDLRVMRENTSELQHATTHEEVRYKKSVREAYEITYFQPVFACWTNAASRDDGGWID